MFNNLRAANLYRQPCDEGVIRSEQAATPWALIYYTDAQKSEPLSPPFDLDAPDGSRARTAQNQEAIWAAYEELVAYAAAHLEVVTSEDIAKLATEGS